MSEPAFPILNSFIKSLDMITPRMAEELRHHFLERVNKNPDLYYEEDIQRVKTNDWTVRRFLYNYKTKPDLNKGLEALDKAMKWRKTFDVLNLNEEHFPQEFYCSAAALVYGTDLNGSPLLIFRGKVGLRSKTWLKTFQRGLTILVDFSDTGIQNTDKETLKFAYLLFNEYYPGIINATLLYKMPTILETIYKMVSSWLQEEQRNYTHFLNKKNINQFIAAEQLPPFLMGTNTRSFRTVPENSPSAHELAEKLGISLEKTEKLVKHLQRFYRN